MTKDKPSKPDNRIKEQPVTYDDYARLPDDGIRYEINNGQLEALTPGPNAVHQLVVQQIEHRMLQKCASDFIVISSPIDVILSETEVRQPDIVMIRRDRLSIITKRGIEGPPDLVVEVLSPFSAKRDRQKKLHAYAKYAIPEYWIVDVNNELLELYVLTKEQYTLQEVYFEDKPVVSKQIPCISFTMQEIIESIPELPNF
ncbi:Uma2 family endonuclease [Dethiobacter alkaliphilus]|uniref:Uma2 family endonuclease n=1 Tax=Dethiobacter alkaliphilus TaxID=427926 RepID=UPI002227B931|nr:Uma2 family endonuclease [Dethiobacter alkaliphilus]MCW3489563.1 Uma2 family endonuclease [Dethiobacter alkaliphilus]